MFQGMEYVYEVYLEKSFSKAAEKLFISQPSLSANVKRVEHHIGYPIFDRSTKPLSLTECGVQYIKAVEKIKSIQNEFEGFANDWGDLKKGTLTLGGSNLFSSWILPSLIERWVSINFIPVVSKVKLSDGAYIDWNSLPAGAEGIKTAISQYASGMALEPTKVTTLQDNLNSLIPGLMPLLLTLLCMWLLKKKVSPIVIILALFVVGILGHVVGIL